SLPAHLFSALSVCSVVQTSSAAARSAYAMSELRAIPDRSPWRSGRLGGSSSRTALLRVLRVRRASCPRSSLDLLGVTGALAVAWGRRREGCAERDGHR